MRLCLDGRERPWEGSLSLQFLLFFLSKAKISNSLPKGYQFYSHPQAFLLACLDGGNKMRGLKHSPSWWRIKWNFPNKCWIDFFWPRDMLNMSQILQLFDNSCKTNHSCHKPTNRGRNSRMQFRVASHPKVRCCLSKVHLTVYFLKAKEVLLSF